MKPAPIPALMWFVVLLPCAYLSIANPANTNDTADTSASDGSVQDCLIGRHLEAEFSTITSSHFGRMLIQNRYGAVATNNPGKPVCQMFNQDYRGCFPNRRGNNGADPRCNEPSYRTYNPNC